MTLKERPGGVSLPAVTLIGMATLLFEVLLTRIFSVTMWYHFAFVAISLALFGISASGAVVTLAPRFFALERAGRNLAWSAVAFGAAIPISFLVDQQIPFLPFDGGGLSPYLFFFLKFLVLSLPFFFSGLVLAIAFTHFSARANRIYFADLVGAGIGCAAVVPVLLAWSGPTAVIATSALPLAAAAAFFRAAERRRAALGPIAAAALVLALSALNERSGWIAIRKVKSYTSTLGQEPERPKLYERWHPVSRVAVHPAGASGSTQSWFHADGLHAQFPRMLEVTNDAGARTHIYPKLSHEEYVALFKTDVSDAVYAMAREPEVLVVGVGGGKDVVAALHLGAKKVVGVELNPRMIDVVQRDFAGVSGAPLSDPRVEIVIDEGRNFIANADRLYDVIKISVTDTWAASAGGGYALSESYLYTREAFGDFMSRLRPDGFLSMTRWYPQETLRLAALAVQAMRDAGVADPSRRLAMVRNRSTMTLIARPRDFTAGEVKALVEAMRAARLTVVHAPGVTPPEGAGDLDEDHRRILRQEALGAGSVGSGLDLSPPIDDRPFFFSLVSFGSARQGKFGADQSYLLQHGRALALLVGMLEISVLVSLAFVLGPILFLRRREQLRDIAPRVRFGGSLYFLALGLGYLLVEIPLMQRFILFLGHPVYAVTVVLFSMLVSSGAGSFLADRLMARPWYRPRVAIALASATLVLVTLLAPALLRQAIGASLPVRAALSVAIIAPVGLLLGIPFPTGIRALSESGPALIPWAWAVNGAASVAAPVVAMILAIASGFSTALFAGAGIYAAAALLFGFLRPS